MLGGVGGNAREGLLIPIGLIIVYYTNSGFM